MISPLHGILQRPIIISVAIILVNFNLILIIQNELYSVLFFHEGYCAPNPVKIFIITHPYHFSTAQTGQVNG
jgi:hypothetical protein